MPKKPNLKVLAFPTKKEEKNETPPFILENLEKATKLAKEGKLKKVIIQFDFEGEDSTESTIVFWHEDHNIWEIVGNLEAMKALALGTAMGSVPVNEFDE